MRQTVENLAPSKNQQANGHPDNEDALDQPERNAYSDGRDADAHPCSQDGIKNGKLHNRPERTAQEFSPLHLEDILVRNGKVIEHIQVGREIERDAEQQSAKENRGESPKHD